MNSRKFHRPVAGFSLIEVMVAIVILSIGLLALASLQLTLIRSSSETKAQSTAMSLAKERLETLASYSDMAGYRGIIDEGMADVAGNPIGGVNYQRSIDVSRYVFDRSILTGSRYALIGDALTDAQITAASASYLPGREFKRLVATVQWNDAAGVTQRVRVEDAISALDPADTMIVNQHKDYGAARKAVAIITNPASVAGVIPIAIGNGTDTAATNPRPILLSQGSSTTLVETRFDIYTYAALAGTTAQAQSRVETSVIGCTCRTGSGTQTSFRPTYWNGTSYIAPDTSSLARTSAGKTGIDQSTLCTACCRDHQDPSGVPGEKFDPRRSTHSHYLSSDLSAPIDMTVANTDYNEACRLIRVDGLFRVAAEPYNDDFRMLATAGLNQSGPSDTIAEAVPGTSQTTNYQTFVLNYLKARFRTAAKANYNVPLNPTTITGESALNLPSTAGIATTSNPQYLHARGLFVDYLTDDVREMVYQAGLVANCKGTDGLDADSDSEFAACVFKLLPFTSINLTEIASWSSTAPTKVEVKNNDFKTTVNSQFPVKGKAELKGGANPGDTSTGEAIIQRTSAGLAVTQKVFPDTALTDTFAPNMLDDEDNQDFLVGSVIGTPSDDLFYLAMTGSEMLAGIAYGAGNAPQVGFSLANGGCNVDENTGGDSTIASDMDGDLGNDDGTKPDEFRCIPDTGNVLGGSVTVEVSNYNRIIAGGVSVANSCRNLGEVTTMPYAKDYDVIAVSASTLVTPGVDANSDGDYLDVGDTAPVYTSTSIGTGTVYAADQPGIKAVNGEYTNFIVNPLNDLMRIVVEFGNFTYRCPSNYATFITNTGGWINLTNPDKTANCSDGVGNGPSNTPLWSSTYSACPTGFAPFLP